MSKLQEPFRYDYVGSFLRTEEEQWAKLKLVKEIAEEVWGE